MAVSTPTGFGGKVLVSLLGGVVVGATGAMIDAIAITGYSREVYIHQFAGDVMAAVIAMLVCLALQLRNEELHYRFAMERAAIVAELNHHVRNAIFPLCLAVQRTGDIDSQRLANDAIERINIAMKEAATDVFAMRLNYAPAMPTPIRRSS